MASHSHSTGPRHKPRIAVTMGDAAGIGPEICLRLLANRQIAAECTPIVFGDAALLQRVAAHLEFEFSTDWPVVAARDWSERHSQLNSPAILDFALLDAAAITPGQIDARCGEAAYRYIIAAIDAGLEHQVDAVSTGPINKEALHAAGHLYPGHTEIFAERMHSDRWCMLMTSAELTCGLVTSHVGYHQVPVLLTVDRIREVIELTAEAMQRIRGRAPRLLVCGLNPHAGEHGLFGQGEEERLIVPAIEAARARGLDVTGPVPPDTAFLPWRRRAFDAVVCMYHDQGLIPLKALAFDSAINVTVGLPVPRTSVDHGTAFDIAWRGTASAQSLQAAVLLAAQLGNKGSEKRGQGAEVSGQKE